MMRITVPSRRLRPLSQSRGMGSAGCLPGCRYRSTNCGYLARVERPVNDVSYPFAGPGSSELTQLLLLLVEPEQGFERCRSCEIELAQLVCQHRRGRRGRRFGGPREEAELRAAAPAAAGKSRAPRVVQLLRFEVREDLPGAAEDHLRESRKTSDLD